jgi:hypothetical protein
MKPTVWRLEDAVKDLKDIEGKGRGERDGKEREGGEGSTVMASLICFVTSSLDKERSIIGIDGEIGAIPTNTSQIDNRTGGKDKSDIVGAES